MRKLVIPILLIALLAGCQKESQLAQLSGKIEGMTTDTLYLFSIDETHQTIDTIAISNGKFVHELQIDTLSTYMLLFNRSEERRVGKECASMC